jgi:hypothetical protein
MPVTLGNFKTHFARGRLSLVKIKSFHQKQSRLVGEMEEEPLGITRGDGDYFMP